MLIEYKFNITADSVGGKIIFQNKFNEMAIKIL